MISLTNSVDCENYLRSIWEKDTIEDHERLYAVYLNANGQREMHKCICVGRYTGTDYDLRKIARIALDNNFDYVVIAHNHPHGNSEPSENDKIITKHIYTTLCALDIELLDHVILTSNNYYSFKDSGIIESYKKACTCIKVKA